MKKLIAILFLIFSIQSIGQTEIRKYNKVIDYDGYRKREYLLSGKWVSTDSTLIKFDSGYQLDKNLIEVKGNTRVYLNDFNEKVNVVFMPNSDVIVRNQSYPNQYTIYRFVKKS